jgi:hypothetical protein
VRYGVTVPDYKGSLEKMFRVSKKDMRREKRHFLVWP